MDLSGVSEMFKNLGRTISKNGPSLLTGMAVAGLITTTALAVKATPKALVIIDDELYNYMGEDMYGEHGNTIAERVRILSAKKTIKLVWKCYIPAGAVGLATIGCIIGANSINLRRNAALASIYTITETAFKEYQSKVVETVGKNKELKLRDEISSDRIKENPPCSREIILTGKGEVLCFDSLSGRYFKSDIEKIRRVINELNRDLMSEMFITLNELYSELGLARIKLGDEMGWDVEKGLIDISFSTQLTENEEPCLVLNYDVYPRFM